ncbi:hypothetical protein PENTCL1PPCAC_20307, partial [Pristionchus entomophagus]
QIIIRCYDILPLIAFILYALITGLLLKRKREITTLKRRNNDFKILAQGFIVLVVYGVPGSVMQFLLFLYISIDIITVALIPLSVILTSPALRSAPREC